MKGFKKDGKFIPTEKRSKSVLSKKDMAMVEKIHNDPQNIADMKKWEKERKAEEGSLRCNECGATGLSEMAYKRSHGVQHHPTPKMLASRKKESVDHEHNHAYEDDGDEPKQTFSEFLKSGHYLEGEIKERAKKGSPHWFDEDSMRFFSSRVTNLMWKKGDDIYFVSSEQNKSHGDFGGTPRAYTVRIVGTDGDINDIGGFQAYETVNQARHAIQDIIEGNED